MGLWNLVGGLALARMRPILEVTGTACLAELDEVVDVLGCQRGSINPERIAPLRDWRRKIGPLEDASLPIYFQSTAAGVAILVASDEVSAGDLEWRIGSSVGNFWDSCDDLLQAGGGYSRSEFQGIKTTLRGVENAWRDGDIRLLSDDGADVERIYGNRLTQIRSHYPKRRQIARVVAECAGWDIPAAPL